MYTYKFQMSNFTRRQPKLNFSWRPFTLKMLPHHCSQKQASIFNLCVCVGGGGGGGGGTDILPVISSGDKLLINQIRLAIQTTPKQIHHQSKNCAPHQNRFTTNPRTVHHTKTDSPPIQELCGIPLELPLAKTNLFDKRFGKVE